MLNGLFSSFMVDTWAEASIMAVVAGTVGFFVIIRGSTFAAHAIPQGAFTGAAGAALIGASTFLGVGISRSSASWPSPDGAGGAEMTWWWPWYW